MASASESSDAVSVDPFTTEESLGRPLHCPPAGRAVRSRVWLKEPAGSGCVMDPGHLAAALGRVGGPRLSAEASR